jgi:hypothetical protein
MKNKRSRGRRTPTQAQRAPDLPPPSPALKAAFLEIVDNQLRDGTPPETRQTFERLLAEGHSPDEARRMIANVVVQEIFRVMKYGEAYDQQRYVAALRRLPDGQV